MKNIVHIQSLGSHYMYAIMFGRLVEKDWLFILTIGFVLTEKGKKMDTNRTEEMIIKRDVMGFVYSQTPLVRCKDCKHRYNGCCYNKETKRINFTIEVPDDWFCADGERRK